METTKTVKVEVLRGDERKLHKVVDTWNIAVWRWRREQQLSPPATLIDTMTNYYDFYNVARCPVFCSTGFAVNIDGEMVKLTTLDRYQRATLKVGGLQRVKREVDEGAKLTNIMLVPPRPSIGRKRWMLHFTLRKDVNLVTVDEFKDFEKVAVLAGDLNSRHGVAYSLWTWNVTNGCMRPVRSAYLPKVRSHMFQRKNLEKLQRNHGCSVKHNIRYHRIVARMRRQDKDWVEKSSKTLIDIASETRRELGCDASAIAFEDLKDYKAKKRFRRDVNRANNRWLTRIAMRTHEKALWRGASAMTYIPPRREPRKTGDLRRLLVDAYMTSRTCSRCGGRGFVKGNEFRCSHCGLRRSRHFNAADNIAKRAAERLKWAR